MSLDAVRDVAYLHEQEYLHVICLDRGREKPIALDCPLMVSYLPLSAKGVVFGDKMPATVFCILRLETV